MTAAAFFAGGAVALWLFARVLGKMISTVNPIEETPLPFEPGREGIPYYQRTDIRA